MPATVVSLRHHTDMRATSRAHSILSPVAVCPRRRLAPLSHALSRACRNAQRRTMASITPGQAAELTGKHRSTIIRAIEKGSLSAARDEGGHYLIDPAELERAYGSLRIPGARDVAERHDAPDLHVAALTREVELLRDMLAEVRATSDRDRRTWEDERTFLRGLVDRRDEQLKLLTDQRQPPPRPGFWQRLMRRA